MFENERIAFIGNGVMAQAMIAGLVNRKLFDSRQIIASGPREGRGQQLHERYGIHHTTCNLTAIAKANIVVLAVKPQVMSEVLNEIQGKLHSETLIVSIAAGIPVEKMVQILNHDIVVRVMPNTPTRVGQGMCVWTATKNVSPIQRSHVQAILGALGKEIFVDHEYYLDMATALSGTGPAYIFLFIEALIDSGVHMGFSRRVSQELVLQTMEGTVAFARKYPRHPAELRNMVTSPGGTTTDAIYQFEKGGFRTIISKAVFAAYQKSKTLGRGNS
ncbi:MAG: pyrroline-5-carboxylate reductase [Anaerolineaceae bacterium 4572_78]|nr:MAG: pyrroline-5-carboxylate reductase [Anaerolineaceae bacterium 4572_78]